jgi:hypothetical protein
MFRETLVEYPAFIEGAAARGYVGVNNEKREGEAANEISFHA